MSRLRNDGRREFRTKLSNIPAAADEAGEKSSPRSGRARVAQGANRRHFARPAIIENCLRTVDDEALRLVSTDPPRCGLATLPQQRRTMPHAVGVGSEDVDEAFVQHFLAEIARGLAETTRQAARRHLHPHARMHQRDERVVMPLDPREALRMRQQRGSWFLRCRTR